MANESNIEKKKVVFSALKPTGDLTIGNYIGALKNMVEMSKEHDCYYAVADLHSLTVDNVPADLRKRTYDFMAFFIAIGLDPEKSTLFVQSHVPAHSELAWTLNCYTQYGEAKRMTQFKDKSQKAPENVNVGLFAYPTLMAADILLYQADLVPIGKDQKQHLELARTIAERFNNKYSPTFVVPDGIFPKTGAKIYSLLDPTAKMGKTDDNANGTVFLLDDPDTVMRKFKRAVTDSDTVVKFSADKPGISNLLTIYSTFGGVSIAEAEKQFEGVDYATFKTRVGEAVVEYFRPIRKTYSELIADKGYLESIMKAGAEKASRTAYKTIAKVYRKIGLVPPVR
ncbi:MAG: tryptophan--tRNA ligase [Clostridia bacterium]|nr:tryptophan--tRNA ligase [Clostridia bacterium]